MGVKDRTGVIGACAVVISICLCISLFLPGCGGEEDDFKEVSRLISERNKGRYETAKGKSGTAAPNRASEDPSGEENQRSYKLLYEEEVEIRNVSSKKVIGKGTAYLDKNGKIIQIRIKR